MLAAYTLGLPAPLPPLAQQLLPCMLRLNFSQLLSTSFSLASCPCPAPTHCLSPLTEQITSSTRPQIRDQRPPTLRSTCRQMRKAGAPNLIMSGRLAALISAITAALFSPSVVAPLTPHTMAPTGTSCTCDAASTEITFTTPSRSPNTRPNGPVMDLPQSFAPKQPSPPPNPSPPPPPVRDEGHARSESVNTIAEGW